MDVCAWLFSWLSCCAVAMPSVKRAGGGAGEGAAPPPQKTKYSDHPGTDTLLLPPFLPSSLAGFLASFLPSFLPPCLPACLPACLPSFLPSSLEDNRTWKKNPKTRWKKSHRKWGSLALRLWTLTRNPDQWSWSTGRSVRTSLPSQKLGRCGTSFG